MILRFNISVSILTLILLVSFSCDTVSERSTSNNSQIFQPEFSDKWILPTDEILDGGPGLDGIPSIDSPDFDRVENIDYVNDDRFITGIRIGDTLKAYPHQILDWHEVVNDRINDTHFVITYCPLTGTDIAWNRNRNTEFGVSGLIFRNNLILYDRASFSRFSQMQMRGVNGPMSGTRMETLTVIQTPWSTWKSMFPESKVLTTNTGFSRSYNAFAYTEEYLEEDSATIFPVKHRDDRLPRKKRVHGVIQGVAYEDSNVRVYVIDEFSQDIQLIEDSMGIFDYVVAGSSSHNFAVSFQRNLSDGTKLDLTAVQDSLPVIMTDQEGNYWDVFGYAVAGPRAGSRLSKTNSYTGYWFAWVDFFPDLEIYHN
jgi:hypothetical protein